MQTYQIVQFLKKLDNFWIYNLANEFNALPGSNHFFFKFWISQDDQKLKYKILT